MCRRGRQHHDPHRLQGDAWFTLAKRRWRWRARRCTGRTRTLACPRRHRRSSDGPGRRCAAARASSHRCSSSSEQRTWGLGAALEQQEEEGAPLCADEGCCRALGGTQGPHAAARGLCAGGRRAGQRQGGGHLRVGRAHAAGQLPGQPGALPRCGGWEGQRCSVHAVLGGSSRRCIVGLMIIIPCAGRLEFTSFLPENTQGVVVQPVGSRGVLIAGCDTVRGVGRLDQVGARRFVLAARATPAAVVGQTCVMWGRLLPAGLGGEHCGQARGDAGGRQGGAHGHWLWRRRGRGRQQQQQNASCVTCGPTTAVSLPTPDCNCRRPPHVVFESSMEIATPPGRQTTWS